MARTVAAVLDERAASLRGRERERAALLGLLDDDGPLVVAVHGIAGVGKSTLLRAFGADARARGATVVAVDGRGVEPTPDGALTAIGRATGGPVDSAEEAGAALGALGAAVVLVVDGVERLGMLDPWLCGVLVPALPAHVRVVLAGRHAPAPAWWRTYGDALRVLPLGTLPAADAEAFLRDRGASPEDAVWLVQRVRGLPLSLQLVAGALAAGTPDRAAVGAAVEEVAREYLDGLDPATRWALEAASVTRRTTLALLAALLPDLPPEATFQRLRELPFVELGRDGLVVHDVVRETAAAVLQARDPARHRRYRQAAWTVLRDELQAAPPADAWRAIADVLYLVDDPVVRDFFFPSSVHDHAVAPATAADWPQILAIAEAQPPAAGLELLTAWWELAPEAFAVARDGHGRVSAFRCGSDARHVPSGLVARDPMLRRWREDLRRDPVPGAQRVLFHRFVAARDLCRPGPGSPLPSPGRAALLLDMKAQEVAMRATVRRMYASEPSLAGTYGQCAMVLGYQRLGGQPPARSGLDEASLVLDLGPGLLGSWLAALAERLLLVADDESLDVASRELRLDGARIALTPLELGVLCHLRERQGRVASRAQLLREVWGHEWDGGSNVVDVVVSALRRKLGVRAAALETVRGAGYRLGPLT